MDTITLTTGIIAVVETVKRLVPKVTGVITLALALGLGAYAGYAHLLNTPDILTGIFTGVAAVGTVTVAEKIAGE